MCVCVCVCVCVCGQTILCGVYDHRYYIFLYNNKEVCIASRLNGGDQYVYIGWMLHWSEHETDCVLHIQLYCTQYVRMYINMY